METFVGELGFVVHDEGSQNTKTSHNVFPEEFLDFCRGDGGKRFRFDPFRKVVNADNHKLNLAGCQGKWDNDINPQLVKQLRGYYGRELFSWGIVEVSMSLAGIAVLHV